MKYKDLDKEAFIKIIREHKSILYKVIFMYCKCKEDRKDLEQEIIIQLWKSLKKYDPQYKLSTWIYKVAMNVSISFYRSGLKHKSNKTTLDENILQLDHIDESSERNEQLKMLHLFIGQLGELNKAIILLYLEEKSHKEISEIVGISESNVGTKISRIKQQLKSKVK